MPFDPTKPFELIDPPRFDPSKPFELIEEEPPKQRKGPVLSAQEERGILSRTGTAIRNFLSPIIGETEEQKEEARAVLQADPRLTSEQFDAQNPQRRLQSQGLGGALYAEATDPILSVPRVSAEEVERQLGVSGKPGEALAGALRAGAGIAESLTSPVAIATAGTALAPKIVQRVATGALAADMARHVPEAAERLGTAVGEENLGQIVEEGITGAALVGGTVLAGTHSLKPAAKALVEKSGEILPEARKVIEEVPVEPSAQALGIVPDPTASAMFQKVTDFFKLRETETPLPEIKIDTESVLPRLQDYAIEKTIATNPQGLSLIPGLGKLLDPRAKATAPTDQAIITRAYSTEKGNTFSALWAQTQGRFAELFKNDDSGTFEMEGGKRGFQSDVITAEMANPGSQPLTPAQRAWVNEEWIPVKRAADSMLKDEGVTEMVMEDGDVLVVDLPYFPRPAIGKKGIDPVASQPPGGGVRPGAKPFSAKKRLFESEAEGVGSKQQMLYDPSHISRVSKFISATYRRVADHRLANDPSLGGMTVKERFEESRAKHADLLDQLPKADAAELEMQLRESAAHDVWLKEGFVNSAPAFKGKIFPIETVLKLEKAYGQGIPNWLRKAERVNIASKAATLTLDVSAPLNQGLALLGRYPHRWAKATAKHLQSLFDPQVMTKMLEEPKYKLAAQEFTQSGGTLFRLQDFLEGAKPMEIGPKIKALGPVIEATIKGTRKGVESTGRAFGTFMDIAKMEWWDARSKITPRSEWPKLAESIENSLMTGRMESIGISPARAVGERFIGLAPIYYRGGLSLVVSAMTKGVSGSITRQALASYAGGILALTYGAWKALGLSTEEIIERLDPSKGKLLKVPVPIGDKVVEVGLGGLVMSFVRLGGELAEYSQSDKENDTGDNNPLVRWAAAKTAMWPSLLWEIRSGKDFMGRKIGITEAIVRKFTPLVVQQIWSREKEELDQKIPGAVFSFMGLNSYNQSDRDKWIREADNAAQSKFGKSFSETTTSQRVNITRELNKVEGLKQGKSAEDQLRLAQMAIQASAERKNAMRKRLSESSIKKLEKLGDDIPAHGYTLNIGGERIPLLKPEQKAYEAILAEELESSIAKMNVEALMNVSSDAREKRITKIFTAAKERAKNRIIKEINQ